MDLRNVNSSLLTEEKKKNVENEYINQIQLLANSLQSVLNKKETMFEPIRLEQYEKDWKTTCYRNLKNSFDRIFEKCLATFPEFNENGRIVLQMQLARFYDIDIRNDYLKLFGRNLEEQYYLDKIYDKTLKEVYKKWLQHFEYKQIEEAQKKAKQQNEISNSTAFKILMVIVFVGVLIYLLIKFALIAGITLAVIIFLVILGCAMK